MFFWHSKRLLCKGWMEMTQLLLEYIASGETLEAKDLLNSGKAKVDSIDIFADGLAWTPLFTALLERDVELVEFLLTNGAQLNTTNFALSKTQIGNSSAKFDQSWNISPVNMFFSKFSQIPLQNAKDIKIVALLLANKAEISQKEKPIFPQSKQLDTKVPKEFFNEALAGQSFDLLTIAEMEKTGTLAQLLSCEVLLRGNEKAFSALMKIPQNKHTLDFQQYFSLTGRKIQEQHVTWIKRKLENLVESNLLTSEDAVAINAKIQENKISSDGSARCAELKDIRPSTGTLFGEPMDDKTALANVVLPAIVTEQQPLSNSVITDIKTELANMQKMLNTVQKDLNEFQQQTQIFAKLAAEIQKFMQANSSEELPEKRRESSLTLFK